MMHSMMIRLVRTVVEALGRSTQRQTLLVEIVRPISVLSLVAGGLLATLPAMAAAQCWHCEGSIFGGEGNTICVGGGSGSSYCGQVGDEDEHICVRFDEDDCEDDLFAMDSASDREAVDMIMAGEMLAANAGYYFVVDGEDKVLRRKCGNSLVARVSGQHDRLALVPKTGRHQRLDGLGAGRSGSILETGVGQ